MLQIVRKRLVLGLFTILLTSIYSSQAAAQQSVARQWNEVLLEAIRNDFARPTVHARNLFHISIALYDSWAVYDQTSTTFLLGKTVKGYNCEFNGFELPDDIVAARKETMSYAAYRLLRFRFRFSPGANQSLPAFNQLMENLGYDISTTTEDYSTGSPAALGNYIASCLIAFGRQDNSNEFLDYRNEFYTPVNPSMDPSSPGNQGVTNPNRWQPLSFEFFIDQAGFLVPGNTPNFLGPEWGLVIPFALKNSDLTIYERDGNDYWVYHDPGMPAYLEEDGGGLSSEYQWGNSLVAVWSSHLDPADGVMVDISPASIGNIPELPATIEGLREFYDLFDGGDISMGWDVNPKTGEPYPSQMVPRGDYTRVLAEFWADGPDSETPPGHWFTILNYVSDHPRLEKRFKGEGDVLDELEWDVKSYFALAGAVHDAAVTAWGIKGWYDYIRPISAIRYMADAGQSSDPNLANYSADGLPLYKGFIELVEAGDPLAGIQNENVGKIKLYAWKGHQFISDPAVEVAGVGWVLAEGWWPYQRPTFVTPPFAGYISGHSTFSRAAAEVMTLFTGDEYFPGGVGEFVAKKNEFLVFEEGPSVDVVLQWATYQDASDQTSLSRIWGGIHPPVDDIPGRRIGIEIGLDAFSLAERYFSGSVVTAFEELPESTLKTEVYPNPSHSEFLTIKSHFGLGNNVRVKLMTIDGKSILDKSFQPAETLNLDVRSVLPGNYIVTISGSHGSDSKRIIIE